MEYTPKTVAELPVETRAQILAWFKGGQSINHIVYLLKYEWRIDVVSQVIREALK